MQDIKAKQQIIDKIKSSTNILITVSNDPNVDELASALGLTLMLSKLDKHATAVFSGKIPSAISFLNPEKTFENSADGLRDFIIALNKDKADHLIYRLEGDVVKIYITPYRTSITQDDLQFSQGEYNVELVIAIGVTNKDSFDKALSSKEKILNSTLVTTITIGDKTSDVGSVDWHDQNASSYSEVLVGLSEALRSDKPLLDERVATAFLTGLVFATDRFSNTRTSSKVMTIAAQLMAAGANQQLIANRLRNDHETLSMQRQTAPIKKTVKEEQPQEVVGADKTRLVVNHEEIGNADEIATQVEEANEKAAEKQTNQIIKENEKKKAAASHNKGYPEIKTEAVVNEVDSQEPTLGGTLNATTEQAEEDKKKADEAKQNKTILTHSDLDEESDNNEAEVTVEKTPQIKAVRSESYTANPTLAEIDSQARTKSTSQKDVHDEINNIYGDGDGYMSQPPASQQFNQPVNDMNVPPVPPAPTIPDVSQWPLPPKVDKSGNESVMSSSFHPEEDNSTVVSPTDPGQFRIPNQR